MQVFFCDNHQHSYTEHIANEANTLFFLHSIDISYTKQFHMPGFKEESLHPCHCQSPFRHLKRHILHIVAMVLYIKSSTNLIKM